MLCTKIMADLGADVITIEPPAGMVTRARGPFYRRAGRTRKSLYFWYFHTNKRSITLNLETPEGQTLFKQLVRTADVLVETCPPGSLARLGLGYADLCALHPRLVMTSITGFGSTGPYRHYRAPDIVGWPWGACCISVGNRMVPQSRLAGNKGNTWRPSTGSPAR